MLGPRRLAACAIAAIVSLAPLAGASGDTRQEREQVRREQAAVAADLDVLAARDAEIAAALDLLAANIAAEQAALEAAQAEVARTEARLAEARAAEQELEDEIAATEDDVRTLAVEAYVGTGTATPLGFALSSDDPLEFSNRATLADSATGQLRDALERLEVARQQLEQVRHEAEAAAAQAAALRAEVEGRMAALQTAQEQHNALAAEVAARIEARLSEAAALATLDAELSAELTRQEIELGRRVALVAGATPGAAAMTEPPPLATVRGITVHADIAEAVDALLAAAEEDGIVLGGGGYRDPAAQWALRAAHCPDAANSPPSDCSPPTARPGTSNHERGMAIDFTCDGGGAINSHSSPCFLWLEANAARFGFHNLPSEPWHWSVDGN